METNNITTGESYFDGGLLQLIGWNILGTLITVCTIGICFPWACCMIYNWEIKHTVVNGHRLRFTGTAMQLFGNWIICEYSCAVKPHVRSDGNRQSGTRKPLSASLLA